jgi:CheY-like chemotaxis protein
MPRVLCFDDNPQVLQNIVEIISSWDDSEHGKFEVFSESDFDRVVVRLRDERFDLVTLDLHGRNDPDPLQDDGMNGEQEGQRILSELRKVRFVPVIFYTGYAEKIRELESGVVRVVKKGEDDLVQIRRAINALYSTGISRLLAHLEEENTRYLWDTIDKSWGKINEAGAVDDLAYLVARRLGARLSRESIKEFLSHDPEKVIPIEMYIYPPHSELIKTGCIVNMAEDGLWVIATPACDFAQKKADSILMVGAKPLSSFRQYADWAADRWDGVHATPPGSAQKKHAKLASLLANNAGDRYRFLPGTFFIDNLIVDFQSLKQIPYSDVGKLSVVCRIDSPFREELLSQLSRYYGRMGVPDLNIGMFIQSLIKT